MSDLDWFARQVEMMERKPEDVCLEADIPLSGKTVDGAEYKILRDPFGGWNVWIIEPIEDDYEGRNRVFHGSLNECKNYVYWNMEVADNA